EKIKLLEFTKQLEELGLILNSVANNDIVIYQIPSWIKPTSAQQTIDNIMTYLLSLRNIKAFDIKKDDLIMASCKMSLKAHHYLNMEEMEQLVKDLLKTDDYDHCPHGRPIIVRLSLKDIEKMFKRIV
ncbi:MAG: DNA mismatch repair protein MutL, partial [Bacilli bacterium]|nr:DNA mismatch repair protein MutL [Bacilli bacterium]